MSADITSLGNSVAASLRFAMADDSAVLVADAIIKEVMAYLSENATEDFTSEDIRLAVGRVICKRMGMKIGGS